jgi:hypothetical protein
MSCAVPCWDGDRFKGSGRRMVAALFVFGARPLLASKPGALGFDFARLEPRWD